MDAKLLPIRIEQFLRVEQLGEAGLSPTWQQAYERGQVLGARPFQWQQSMEERLIAG